MAPEQRREFVVKMHEDLRAGFRGARMIACCSVTIRTRTCADSEPKALRAVLPQQSHAAAQGLVLSAGGRPQSRTESCGEIADSYYFRLMDRALFAMNEMRKRGFFVRHAKCGKTVPVSQLAQCDTYATLSPTVATVSHRCRQMLFSTIFMPSNKAAELRELAQPSVSL